MRISVILCTRNRGALIRGTIESILRGTRLPDELLIVDQSDCCDSTEAVVHAFASTAPVTVRYLLSERRGLSLARNEGIVASYGELIAFTDDDAIVRPDWLERLEREFSTYPDLALAFGTVEPPPTYDWRTEKLPYAFVPTRRPVHLFDRQSLGIMGANMALRRAAFERLGPFDPLLGAGTRVMAGEDTEYLLRALTHRPALRVHTLAEARVVHYAGGRAGEERCRFIKEHHGTGTGLFWAHLLRQRRPEYVLRYVLHEACQIGEYLRFLAQGRRPTGVYTHLYRLHGLVQGLIFGVDTPPSGARRER